MSAESTCRLLLEPGRLGRLDLRNRMVMPPMGTGFANADGSVSDKLIAYYAGRAAGGVGLIIVEGSCVDFPDGMGFANQPMAHDDKYVEGLSRLANAIHAHGAPAAVQLYHGGRAAKPQAAGGRVVAPSALPLPNGQLPHALTRGETSALVERFADASRRVKQAGFDGVEIHAAHAYLITNFLSAATNRRDDEYGGDLAGRARFLLEIIHAVRDTVGRRYPVWVRLNGEEMGLATGITLDEAIAVAAMAEAAGADAVHVSAFGYGHPVMWASTPRQAGFLRPLASAVKKAVGIPVIAVGRMTPNVAEQTLAAKEADFIAFGRTLIADPELPRKVADGALDQIRPCIGCVKCRDGLISTGQPITCTVNPAVGREREFNFGKATQSKKVVVVGGGPAGMEAARVAALRGHRVALFEKSPALGGQLIVGANPPEKNDLADLNRYLAGQLAIAGVDVRLGQPATAAVIAAERADGLVLASGSNPLLPVLPGGGLPVVTAIDVLAGTASVGERVAIIGGELVGCETADFLASAGKQVTVLRRGPTLATRINATPRTYLLRRLAEKGVRTLTGVRYEAITGEGIVITNAEGAREVIAADTILLAAGATPECALEQELSGKGIDVQVAGDAAKPRGILEAIADGQRIGMQL